MVLVHAQWQRHQLAEQSPAADSQETPDASTDPILQYSYLNERLGFFGWTQMALGWSKTSSTCLSWTLAVSYAKALLYSSWTNRSEFLPSNNCRQNFLLKLIRQQGSFLPELYLSQQGSFLVYHSLCPKIPTQLGALLVLPLTRFCPCFGQETIDTCSTQKGSELMALKFRHHLKFTSCLIPKLYVSCLKFKRALFLAFKIRGLYRMACRSNLTFCMCV